MSTKGNRSSGTQITPKGVNQGQVLVDPNTGLPVTVVTDNQGKRRLAVDANVTASIGNINVDLDFNEDSVQLGDPNSGFTLKINSDGSIDCNVKVDAADGDNVAIKDSNGDELNINPDGSLNVVFNPLTTPNIQNITTVLANTEYSYTFPINTKKFKIRARGNAKLQLAYTLGQTITNYITIVAGNTHEESGLSVTSLTAYFISNKAGEVVEISSWT
jgi:hypothetical protein